MERAESTEQSGRAAGFCVQAAPDMGRIEMTRARESIRALSSAQVFSAPDLLSEILTYVPDASGNHRADTRELRNVSRVCRDVVNHQDSTLKDVAQAYAASHADKMALFNEVLNRRDVELSSSMQDTLLIHRFLLRDVNSSDTRVASQSIEPGHLLREGKLIESQDKLLAVAKQFEAYKRFLRHNPSERQYICRTGTGVLGCVGFFGAGLYGSMISQEVGLFAVGLWFSVPVGCAASSIAALFTSAFQLCPRPPFRVDMN